MNTSTPRANAQCVNAPILNHANLTPAVLSLIQTLSAFAIKSPSVISFHDYDDVIDQVTDFLDKTELFRKQQYNLEQEQIARLFSQVPVV